MTHSLNASFWPSGLHEVMAKGNLASCREGWLIQRGIESWKESRWKVSNLLEEKDKSPFVTVMQWESGGSISLDQLWPQAAIKPRFSPLGAIHLFRPSLLLCGYEPDQPWREIPAAFTVPQPGEHDTEWGRGKLADCFEYIDLDNELLDPGSLNGLYFEGSMGFGAGQDSLGSLVSLLMKIMAPELEQRITPAPLASGVVRGCICLAVDDESISMKATSFVLEWSAGEQKPLSFPLGKVVFSITALGMRAVLAQGETDIKKLSGAVKMTIGEKEMDGAMDLDLKAKQAHFSARTNFPIGMSWLEFLAGGGLKDADGSFLAGVQFCVQEVRAEISWKADGLQLTSVSVTLQAQDASGQNPGVTLAGGRLTPTLTVTFDFSAGGALPKVNIRAAGKMVWEKLQLDAFVDTESGAFLARLNKQVPQEDFMAAQLGVTSADKSPPAEGGATPAAPKDANLDLILEGNYKDGQQEFAFSAASAQWYQVPWPMATDFLVGELGLDGSYKVATPKQWSLLLEGKAKLGKKAKVELSGSYAWVEAVKTQTLKLKFTAKNLDFSTICERKVEGQASAPAAKSTTTQAQEKKLSSVTVEWTREDKIKDGGHAVANDFTITAKPQPINVTEAMDRLVGWKPAACDEASLDIDKITLKVGSKENSLNLQVKEFAVVINDAKFTLKELSLKVGKERGTASSPNGKTQVDISGRMDFNGWGTGKVAYVLGGDWVVETEKKITSISMDTLVAKLTKTTPAWTLTLKDTEFALQKKGKSYEATLGTTVEGFGSAKIGVKELKGKWTLGMDVTLMSRTELLDLETKDKLNELGKSMLSFMKEISLDDAHLGFCTGDTLGDLKFPGAAMTRGKAGFALTATWDLAPPQSGSAEVKEATVIKYFKKLLGSQAGKLDVRLLLTRSQQELTVALKDWVLQKGGQDSEKVTLNGALSMEHTDRGLSVRLKASAEGFLIGETRCSAEITFEASIGSGAELSLMGKLSSTEGTAADRAAGIVLWKNSSARLMNAGLMIRVGTSGASFSAWGAVTAAGGFSATAYLHFQAGKTLVAFAISNLDLAQAVRAFVDMDKDNPIALVLERIRLLGIPLVENTASASAGSGNEGLRIVPVNAETARDRACAIAELKSGSAELTNPAVVECHGEGDTWHLMDKETLVQYTLQRAGDGWSLERKFQFRIATANVTIGGERFKQGVYFSGQLEILDWKAKAEVDISPDGAYIYGHLKPLKLGILSFPLLELTACKVFLDDNKKVKKNDLSKLVPDPDRGVVISLATFAATRKAPDGVTLHPNFLAGKSEDDFFSGRHGYANGYLRLFGGLATAGVDCQISDKGMYLLAEATLLTVMKCTLEISVFSGSGFSLGAALSLSLPAIDLEIIKLPPMAAGGYLKIQVGGPDVALAASLGAYFEYDGKRHVLGTVQITLTKAGLTNLTDLLTNAVTDCLTSNLGFSEAKELEGKDRWLRVEIINDTPFSLVWKGDKNDPTLSDIQCIKGFNSPSGKYWQAPADIAAYEGGTFAACERANAITGCGGVTTFEMQPPGSLVSAQTLNVGWSHPLVGGIKCGGTFKTDKQAIWDNLGSDGAANNHSSIGWPGHKFEAEIKTQRGLGYSLQVHIRQVGRIAAGKVSYACLGGHEELVILSPGGMLYCRSRKGGGGWTESAPPRPMGHGISQAAVVVVQTYHGTVFGMLAIATNYQFYTSTKLPAQSGWKDFEMERSVSTAVPVSISLLKQEEESVEFFISGSQERAKYRARAKLSVSGTVLVEPWLPLATPAKEGEEAWTRVMSAVTEAENSRDLVAVDKNGEAMRIGIGSSGQLVVEGEGRSWGKLLSSECGTAPQKIQRFAAVVQTSVLHIVAADRDGALWIITQGSAAGPNGGWSQWGQIPTPKNQSIGLALLEQELWDQAKKKRDDLLVRMRSQRAKNVTAQPLPPLAERPLSPPPSAAEQRFHTLSLVVSRENQLVLFAIDQNRNLWHTSCPGHQTLLAAKDNYAWVRWNGCPCGSPAEVEKVTCAAGANGEIEAFAITASKDLWSSRLNDTQGTGWTNLCT